MQHEPHKLDDFQASVPDSEAFGEVQRFVESLRDHARMMRVCQRCGSSMLAVDATFSERYGDRSWDIPLPFCPQCDFQMLNLLQSNAA
jgi:hypothetical protein